MVVSWTTPWADACKTWQCEALRLAARSLAINLAFSGRAHGCFNLRNCSLEPRNATKDTTDGRVFVASTTGSLDFLDALTWSKRSRFAEGRIMRDISVLYTLRRFAWHFVGVDHSRGDVRLYTRGDALLRRLLGWERFATHFDTVHTSMKGIPFAEQVRAFAGARVFVSPCGAHTTNIMFMHSTATMVDVQIHAQNSWQVSMGDSKLIRRYMTPLGSTYVRCNRSTKCSMASRQVYFKNGTRKGSFDDDLVMDDTLWGVISRWL